MPNTQHPLRILALVTDAFGGRGGIAQANRDLLSAMALDDDVVEIVAVPRVMIDAIDSVPSNIDFRTRGARGALAFLGETLRALVSDRDFDLILCGHIHLTPVAWVARTLTRRASTALVIHGIEAWRPTGRWVTDRFARRADAVIAVSELTRQRFLAWSGFTGATFVLPNCVHLERFDPGPKPADLVARHGLEGRKVVMTLGRIESRERAKGFDEVLRVLHTVADVIPEVVYVVAGDGNDRRRLEQDAAALGIADRVVFTGWIPEERKDDALRLADLFVLPSRGEGFGIVLLEALANGVPVIASRVDGTREALLDGRLGRLVDPSDPSELCDAIVDGLLRPAAIDRELLAHFGFDRLVERAGEVLRAMDVGRQAG